jgi:hypothetical protein
MHLPNLHIVILLFYNNNMQIRYMHKLSMRETVKGIGAKKWKYELQFKGL